MTCWILSPFDCRSHDPVGGPAGPGGAAIAVGAIASEPATRTEVANATSLRRTVWLVGFERVGAITSHSSCTPPASRGRLTIGRGEQSSGRCRARVDLSGGPTIAARRRLGNAISGGSHG